ncbi:MAG: tRNA (adenosine(37)-N6)-threonylcarbamoyltransferase complex transferase subunit TsaD [Patescibacteria group bacterium]
MIISAIESSCDETGIAILKATGRSVKLLSNIVVSQIDLHAKYGGVVPEVAARQHILTLPPALTEATKEAGIKYKDINVIAVAAGPGLVTSLISGVETARTMAAVLNKKLVAINHMEAHILANWLPDKGNRIKDIKLPAICLTVSGGHTELVLVNKIGDYKIVGRTRDDAAGEAFDKISTHLGLGYPGGPAISKAATKGRLGAYKLPRPMIGQPNYDFSFSGLKTAVVYETMNKKLSHKQINNLCADFQQAVIDVLIAKTIAAAKYYNPKSILLAGGVAANKELRQQLAQAIKKSTKTKYYQPNLKYCTDNAAMIAIAGYFNTKLKRYTPWQKIEANPNWELK